MRKYLTIIFFVIIGYTNLFAAPGDDCSTAIAVSSNGCSSATAYDNTGITGTLAPPSCFTGGNNNGMWFKFVATTRIVNITVNGATLTQPQIALLQPAATGCTGTFTELTCNSSGAATATINYSNLTIGTTYYIYVDGSNNLVGTFQLCLTSPIAPTNDNPCNAIVVPASNFCSGANAYTNVGAGSENLFSASYPGCWSATGAFNTVFFQFTALGPFNTITVSGAINQPQIAVIQTGNCNGATWTSNGASSCATTAGTSVTMNANNLIAGQTYLIAVDGSVDNVGSFQLCVNSYTPTSGVPANDRCSGAQPLCPNQFISSSTVNATGTGDVNIGNWICNAVLDNPVWFTFAAANPVQNVVMNLNAVCTGDDLQVEIFKFTGASGPCNAANSNQFTSIGCDNSISGSGSAVLTIPAANMVAGQTYYILVDNWPGESCDFNFTISGIAGADAGADQDVCISAPAFNVVGTPAGGTWSGPGITNTSNGTFNPQVAGYGTHTLFYNNGACTDQKIINVTGPQVVTSNDVAICGGSTQLVGSVNEYPLSGLKVFTNPTDFVIPDNNTTGITSPIVVSGVTPALVSTNPIQRVCMNINHPFDGDLDIYLQCPGGTQIELSTDNGGSGDNYTNTCFVPTGTAITAGASPFTGNFTPEQALTLLNACNVNGTWNLVIKDDAGGDVGTLLDWSIYFNTTNTVNYVWSPTTNMTGSTTLSPTVTPTTTTSYYLTATDNNGCTDVDTVVVSLGGSIAGPDQSICLNTSTSFASSGTGTWTPLATNPAAVTITSVSNPTSNVGPFNTAGTYNFEWNTGSCKDTVRITVNNLPIANAGIDRTLDCTTSSFVIGTPAVAGNTYSWSPGTGLSANNIAQPTVTAAGTYTVTVTNAATTCFATDAVVISQTATLPPANAGVDKTLTCAATSAVIGSAAVAGNTYSWSPGTGLSANNIAQPTATAAGTYTVTVTNTANGCTASDAVIVSQNTTPPVANAGADKSLTCAATTAVIGSAAVAGNTYAWSPGTGLSANNIAQPTATAAGTYTVTVTNTANGCTASDAVIVSQNTTPPVANAGADKSLTCAATSAVIGSAAVAGNTYSWSPGTGLSANNIAQPTATAAGTYTVTVTNTANGCTATDAVIVSQNTTPPVANAGTDKSLTCVANSAVIGSAAVAGNTYAWSPGTGLFANNIAQPTATAAGTYTVTVTNTANGCTATDAVIVSQNTTPPVANAGTDKSLTCTATSAVIGSAALAGNTYSWSPGTGLSANNIAQPTATAAGTYTVTVTNTANGCTASDAVIVSQNTTPPVANAGADKSLTCAATSAVIGSAAVAGNTYAWSPGTGLSANNIAQPTANAAGTYTVTVTNTANGCTATDAVIVSQNTTPPVANAGADKSLTCTATSAVIGSAALAGNTYSWSPGTGLSANNIAQPTANAAGTYTVTVTNTANGCTATDAVIVSQNTTPPVANAGADKSLTCTANSAVIGSAALAGNTYSWSPGTGLSANNIAQPTANAAGTYTVTVTNTANGCTASDAVIVSQNTTPPVANAGADKSLTCAATSAVIGSAAVAGNTYAWSPGTGLSANNIAQPTANAAGTYTVTVTNTANGCTASDAVIVSQNTTPPVANAGADKSLTCAANSAVIGSAALAGNTYSWSPGTGLSANNIAQPTANAAGTYTVTVTNTANGCTASDAVIVSVDTTRPTVNAGADKSLTCAANSAVIGSAALAGNTYSWSPGTGLSANNIAQPTANAAGTYTVTVTNTANGCTASDAVIVSQNTTPPVANAGADKSLTCAATSAVIGSAAVAGNTYSWSPGTGLSANNIAQPTANAAGTYTVTVTNTANGCTATDAVIVSQNTTPPVANAGTDKSLTCAATSAIIGSAALAGNTYSWSPGTGLSANNIAQPTATAAGTYTVTVTNTANGCTATDAVIVSQNTTPPVANAGADKSLTCAATSAVIGSAAVAGNTYSWSPGTGLSANNIAQPTANAAGTYTVTVTNTANGCTATDAVIVSQNTTPPVANAGADKSLTCVANSAVIGSAAVAGNTYAWSPGTGLSANNIAQPTANAAGTYTVTVTNTANGCTASDAVIVSQNTTPPVANAGADKSLTCTATSAVIGSAAVTGNTYAWSPGTGLSANNIAQPTATAAGTYTVTVTNTANGCTASDAVIVSQNTTPPVANAGADKSLTCAATSAVIGSAALAGNTYSWSPGTGLSANNIAQPTATAAGTYTVTVTNTANGCTATDAVIVSQNTTPPVANAGADKSLTCIATSAVIGSAVIAGNTYSWSPGTGLSANNIAQPTATAAGTYTVTVTNTANGCTATDAVIVSVDTTRPTVNAGADIILTCTNPSKQIGTTSVAGITYTWSPTTGLDNPNTAQPTTNTTGTYTVTATKTSNGCSKSDNVLVTQDTSFPVANAGIDQILTCIKTSAIIGSVAVAGNTYSWSPSAGLSNVNNPQPKVDSTGTFTLTVTKTSNGCKTTDAVTITRDTVRPVADAGDSAIFDCPHIPITLGTPAVAGFSYHWTNVTGISATNIAQPTTDTAGNYVLVVTNDINGCVSKPDTVKIKWKNCECEFLIPSAFSPNGDGINDDLKPLKFCDDYTDLEFSVFNRWGALVFKSNNIIDGWNGFLRSEEQQVDSYIWTLSYYDILHKEKIFKKGTVTLLK